MKLAVSGGFVKTAILGLSLVFLGRSCAGPDPCRPARLQRPDFRCRNSQAAPQGWSQFCDTFRSECTVDVSEANSIDLTPQVWKTIVSVNQRVNLQHQGRDGCGSLGRRRHLGFPR